ncbi:MAG: hypothetical protein GY750_10120 [Lentisphaerae bacterium]|nr:hypothetical protein [Lentisphaerota bacterium]MCP4101765.1 hypothetical protein [Lentisphaerota bacterium]
MDSWWYNLSKNEMDTPCLVLDIDHFEKNLRYMYNWSETIGKKLRPHAKTHKCSEIAKRQLAEGNCAGVCAAKISEAEVLLESGIKVILITSPVVTPFKINRLIGFRNHGSR